MGLISKLFAPFLIAGFFILPRALAQESQADTTKLNKKEFVPKTYISGGIGWYRDDSKAFQKIYGSVFGWKLEALRDFNKNFRGEAGFSVFSKSIEESRKTSYRPGESPILSPSYNLSIINFGGSVHYCSWWTNNLLGYTKAGFMFSQARESVGSDKASGQGIGINIGGGLELNLDNEYKSYLELLYKSVSSDKLDLSGGEIRIGVRRDLGIK